MLQYKFVAVEGGDGKPSKLTRSSRSHAIRAGLQKTSDRSKAKAAVQSLRSTKFREENIFHFELHGEMKTLRDRATPSIVAVEPTTSELRTANAQSARKISAECSIQLPAYRIESMYAGSVDPFNSLPIPTNPEVDYLVRYFLNKYGVNLATVDRKKSWFPFALQSAPMMHSTLAMTAASLREGYPALGSSIQLEGIRQKGEAIREIRTRLALASSVRNNDEIKFLMSAMSTMAIVEILDSDFEAAETHLRGVHNLFSSRGGCDSFKDEFILYKSINLADIQVATALGHQLKFPLLHTDQTYLPASILEHALHPPLDHSIIGDGSYDHGRIFAQLRQLLLARQSPVISVEDLRILFNVVDDSILRHLYQDCIDISDASRRSRALVFAAHVFMCVTLRQVPPKSPLLRRICTRLQSTVGLTPTSREIWIEARAALLWIAFVGLLGTGEGSETCPEGQWFLNLFQSTVQGYLLGFPLGNDGVRRILSTFLWDELYCQPVLAGLEGCLGS